MPHQRIGTRLRVSAIAILLLAGFYIQIHFLTHYPQPILFGDPGAYYVFGQKIQEAVSAVFAGVPMGEVLDSVRGYFYFAGVACLYAAIDAIASGNIEAFRIVLALFNTFGMLGAFFLARRLSGSFLGGLIALSAAAVYPSFSVQTGRLFPDPVVGALIVWSAYLCLIGLDRRRLRWMAASGLALTGALFVRAQMFNYVLLLLTLTALSTAPLWSRDRDRRSQVMAFALGALPLTLLFTVLVSGMGGDFRKIEEHGFFALPQQQRYPYGFWMFLDSDGWVGPYRIEDYPFYRTLREAAADDPMLLQSRARQYGFVARYVGSRLPESITMVADNVYRLYTQVANQYRWDYPFSVGVQNALQRTIVVLSLCGAAFFASTVPARSFVFFMPAAVGLLHGLSFPEARYNQPVMLILLAFAGAFVSVLIRGIPIVRGWSVKRHLALGGLIVGTLLLALAGEGARETLPFLARVMRFAVSLTATGLVFLLAHFLSRASGIRLAWLASAWAVLVALIAVHAVRDRRWHEIGMPLGGETTAFEQEIRLSGPALARLREARSLWCFLDLHVPDGNVGSLGIRVNGRAVEGRLLIPTMPRFGSATVSGGRNPRGYPQWWAFPFPREPLAQRAPASVTVRIEGGRPSMRLFADRFSRQDIFYEGPSFGEWPNQAMLKLVHDGDYRIPTRTKLESNGTRSYRETASDGRAPLDAVLRIRLVVLEDIEGRLEWRAADAPAAEEARIAFYGYSGKGGNAELLLNGTPVTSFPLGAESDFDVTSPPFRLCYRADAPRGDMAYGGYVLQGPVRGGTEPSLVVRFRAGPSELPLFFSLDRRRSHDDLHQLSRRCGFDDLAPLINGGGEILDSSKNSYPENVGPWSVGGVY